MEDNYSIVPTVSNLSVSSSKIRDTDSSNLYSSHTTWSTRYNCLQAYVCVFASFMSALRFCKSVGKYGIVIFIPFIACNVFVGLPAALVEIMVGRYVIGGAARAWDMTPAAKGILWCLIGTTILAIVQNDVCSMYLLKYFFSSIDSNLKWTSCDHYWADEKCYEIGRKTNAFIKCNQVHSEEYCRNLTLETSSQQFWTHYIRNNSTVPHVLWSITCLFISVCLILIINFKGIRSMEKMFAIIVYCPMILGVILAFASFHFPHSLEGLKELFFYKWDVLLESQIWTESFADTLFFLGLGRLSLTFVSCHGKFNDNILIDLVIILSGSFICCFIITIPILSVMVSVKYLYSSRGPSHEIFDDTEDVFVSISEAMIFYPYPNTLWSAVTFLNWFLISCSNQAVLVLGVCEVLADICQKADKFQYFIVTFSVVSFLLGIGLIFVPFHFQLDLAAGITTIIFLATITWQCFYGIKKFNFNYFFMMGSPLPFYFKITWISLLVVPCIVLVTTLYYTITDSPNNYMVFVYTGVPFCVYILSIIIQIILFSNDKIIKIFMANPDWGPEHPLLKKSRIIFDTGTITREFMYRQELYKKPFMKPPDFSEQNIVQLA